MAQTAALEACETFLVLMKRSSMVGIPLHNIFVLHVSDGMGIATGLVRCKWDPEQEERDVLA